MRFSPERLLVASFALLILLGTVLLGLPGMTHGEVRRIDLLFTSTSAVCVTGLTPFDPGTTLTPRGQGALLLLIQVGGMGIMTLASFFAYLAWGRIGLLGHGVSSASFGRQPLVEVYEILKTVVLVTFGIEAAGAAALYLAMRGDSPDAAWNAVFHAVSAFCNAGFSLHPDSLVRYADRPEVVLPIAGLILLGGIGFPVLLDLWKRFRTRDPLVLTTKLALTSTAFLLIAGTFFFYFFPGAPHTPMGALFLAITPRTAGFETIPTGTLPGPTLVMILALMFVGGSPASTAGGIKTTTGAIVVQKVRSILRGREEVRAFGRSLPPVLVERAFVLVSLYFTVWFLGTTAILCFESARGPVRVFDHAFEALSALGTVGLSTGITAGLSDGSKAVLAALMFLGRVGPLGLMVALAAPKRTTYALPAEEVAIG